MKRLILALALTITCILPGDCTNPFPAIPAFQTQINGTLIYSSTWNSVIGGLWTWISYSLLPQLNVVQNLGDMYVAQVNANGNVNLAQFPVGTSGTVLQADSTQSLGMAWEDGFGIGLVNQGDIPAYSTTLTREPVGANGTVLTVDTTQPTDVNWLPPVSFLAPSGAIVWYNGTSVPGGWLICDGTNGTPNLLGMFACGGQYNGGSSAANPAGFGQTIQGNLYGQNSHTHNVTVAGNTGPESYDNPVVNANPNVALAGPGHIHAFSVTATTTAATGQPSCIGLMPIMKI
jgi:hypothetical protein